MKRAILALVLVLLPAAAGAAVTSECFSSLAEARAAHPVDHLAWSGGCYFKGHKGDRSIGKLVASKPLPRKRPESAPQPKPIEQAEPETAEASINVITTDPSAEAHLRDATREWLAGKYWVLMWRARN